MNASQEEPTAARKAVQPQTANMLDEAAFSTQLRSMGLSSTSAPLIVAISSAGAQGDVWRQPSAACNAVNTAAVLIDERAHSKWLQRLVESPALRNVELALRKLLAEPALPLGAAMPLNPADFIVRAAANQLGSGCIADAWIRGDAQAIAALCAQFETKLRDPFAPTKPKVELSPRGKPLARL
jgi:hypothetical protein